MRFAIAVVLITACGGGSTPPPQPPVVAPAPSAPAPPPAPSIVSTEFDVALAFPAGRDNGTIVEETAMYWHVNHVDLTHTDGRLVTVIANGTGGGSPLAMARELRDRLATQDDNQCGQPEPAEFLGRDGARFTCVLGDGKGTWYFSSTERCFWTAMISKRGPEEEYAPYVEAMLAKITVASGAKAPNVERCY